MHVSLAYAGRSGVERGAHGDQLLFRPNLAREAVSFDARLLQPIRFREAISALHDVVINDLRYQPRDHTAYQAWKQAEAEREATFRQAAYQQIKQEILSRRETPVAADVETRFERCRERYWGARQKYSTYLREHDHSLWRMLMPCDPIVTVAPDVLTFECFSADESSYGCLTAERGLFGPSTDERLGTTNVDYSWNLYHHFQALRSYRETRFRLDPQGFEVAVDQLPDYREEKIDLPAGWLRGLMQVQVAMALPARRVPLTREALYSVLAWLKRHRARKSPRALRFELLSGQAPRLVLEPWEQPIEVRGAVYRGPNSEPVRVWGSRRLLVLSRLLPLIERVDVYLLGTGLPSFWVAHLPGMRLTLGLSGWTTNDWSHGSALDALAPPQAPSADLLARVAEVLRARRSASLAELAQVLNVSAAACAATLHRLAIKGQVIHDLAAGVYRWRQILALNLADDDVGLNNPELAASHALVRQCRIELDSSPAAGLRLLRAQVERMPVELLLEGDGAIKRGRCLCFHHRRAGLRMGPCRHLLALRAAAQPAEAIPATLESWFARLSAWGEN